MIFTPEQRAEFEAVTRPLLKFLCDNCHPHVSVIVTTTTAELLEGVCSSGIDNAEVCGDGSKDSR